jgi:hypothetical protein
MSLKQFENRVGQVGEIPRNLPQNIDSAQPDLKPLIGKLAYSSVEQLDHMGATFQHRFRFRGASLFHFGRELSPCQIKPAKRGKR